MTAHGRDNPGKSLLVGDQATNALLEYAALLAREHSGDTVQFEAIALDGASVTATLLLDPGADLIAETTASRLPEPDNTKALDFMRERTAHTESPPHALPAEPAE